MHIKFFVFTILACSLQALYGSHHTFEETTVKEFELGEEPSISLWNNVGNITISASSAGVDQKITLIKVIKKAQSDARLAQLRVEIERYNNSLNLRSEHSSESIFDESIDYEIVTPSTSKISVKTKHGDISVASIVGLITLLDSNGGRIHVKNAARLKKAHANSGSINVQLNAPNAQIDSCMLDTNMGDIVIQMPQICDATIFAQTNQGTITNNTKLTVTQHEWHLGNGPEWLKAKTNIGDIIIN